MSAIAALTEDFSGASAGNAVTTANTVFDKITGTGTSSIIADPIDSGVQVMRISSAATTRFHELDFAAVGTLWFTFDLDIGTPLPDVNVPILQGFGTSAGTLAEKVFDLRILAGTRTIQIRNSASVAQWASTDLAASTKHRVWVYVKLGATASARRLRVMIFSGGTYTTLSQDSGEIVSDATQATIAHLRLGALISNTSTLRFGRLRGDDSTGPATAPAASVGLAANDLTPEPGATVTLTASTTGTGTLAFTQTAGPTVTLTGSGSTRTFTAPTHWPSGSAPTRPTLTFQATYGGATQTVTVTPYVHTRWRKTGSGWQAVTPARKFP